MMLPGLLLDTQIAEKVLGLEVCKCNHDELRMKAYQDWEERLKNPMLYHGMPNYFSFGSDNNCNYCSKAYIPVHNYSTEITKAWEVVNKLHGMSEGGEVTVKALYDGMFSCTVELRGAVQGKFCAVADDAPHAICLVALKTVKTK